MTYFRQITLIGTCHNKKTHVFSSGKSVTSFALLTKSPPPKSDPDGEWLATFDNVKILSEAMSEMVEKNWRDGADVFVVGDLKSERYITKDGLEKKEQSVIASTIRFLKYSDVEIVAPKASSSSSKVTKPKAQSPDPIFTDPELVNFGNDPVPF